MPYTNDVSPVSEYSYKDFTQTAFDPALTEGYVAGVVAGALVGLSDKLVTLTNGTQYTVRFANKLIQLGQVGADGVTWTPISLAEYDGLQGVPDITSSGDYLIFTWSENDTVHVFGWDETNPTDTVDISFAGISSAFATTLQFGICCVYMGLDGCIHIMERGNRTWNVDHTMSADLADTSIRVARAFRKLDSDGITERLALLLVKDDEGEPAYFYMVSDIETTTGSSTTNHIDTIYPASDYDTAFAQWIGVPDAENLFENINDGATLDTSSYIYSIDWGTLSFFTPDTSGIPNLASVSKIVISNYIETEKTDLYTMMYYADNTYAGGRLIISADDKVTGWYSTEYLISKTGAEIQNLRYGIQQQERVFGSVSKVFSSKMQVYYSTNDAVTETSTMTGFTTQLSTWDGVTAIAPFTWPIDVESTRRVVSNSVDLNGSFFVTPVSVLTTDKLVYGAVIKNTKCVISGDSDGDSEVEDNGSSVVVEDLGALRTDVERKALRFITGMSGRVKLECTRAIAQADNAGELVADA